MDEIVIGKGDKGCTAIKVFSIEGPHGISENQVSYWIWPCLFDIHMTIFKDTKEGRKLQGMIESKTPLPKIDDWINKMVLSHIDHKLLLSKIKQANEKWFEAGKRAKAEEMRKVIGL